MPRQMNIETMNLGGRCNLNPEATRCLEAKTVSKLSQCRLVSLRPPCILDQADCSATRHAALDLPGDLDPASD